MSLLMTIAITAIHVHYMACKYIQSVPTQFFFNRLCLAVLRNVVP